jgi:Di-haem oxidoreductase, putative peroxidase
MIRQGGLLYNFTREMRRLGSRLRGAPAAASRLAGALGIAALVALFGGGPGWAQLGERPGTSVDTSDGPKDLSGLSVKAPRTRIVHTADAAQEGGSRYLQDMDPFLAFKMGKDLTQREFRVRDGVFSASIAGFKGVLSDGSSPAIVGNDQVSCGGCHALPYRDGGAGTNFAKKSGRGRNATHFFGSGLQEMLAWQIRQKMMQQIDTNRNNWVDLAELNGKPILVVPAAGGQPIDYGSSGDGDGDGQPDLNNIFRVWFVDGAGHVVPGATSLDDPGVAGYNFILEVFGWGEKRFNLNTTNRVFAWDPFAAHGGLEAYDPTTAFDPDNDGWSQVSNAGFQQSWIGHVPPDHGNALNSVGLSIDDPDGDGAISEITEGDLDMVEWYMLNSPRPGVGRTTSQTRRGATRFATFGCAGCHVQKWLIEAADPGNGDIHQRYLGDLRLFDFKVSYSGADQRLEGKMLPLYTIDKDGAYVPNRGSFMVPGIGTDFKHHEMGAALADLQYDGTVVTAFRTGLIWGNGATGFPWGHDGASMTLDDIIRRHGGEAQAARDAYVGATQVERDAVLAWLDIQLLYPTDQVPADVDGDGIIANSFMVAGEDTGVERFNPEWLFRVPAEIEGMVPNPQGELIRSDAIVNLRDAYGLDLEYLIDTDLDGFADVQDECPATTGYKDGCTS